MGEFVQERVIMSTMCPSVMRVCAGKGCFWHKCDAGMYFEQEMRSISARNEKKGNPILGHPLLYRINYNYAGKAKKAAANAKIA